MDWETLDERPAFVLRRCGRFLVAGLIGPGDRKSVQPMAERLGLPSHDALHHFITAGVWDAAPLEVALAREADRLVGGRDAFLIVDDTALPKKGERSAGVFARAVMHVPIETARAARDEARRVHADCAVAVGGGSTTGLGKAIALDSGLPIVAVPTTYAGSEMTPIYGLTEGGVKKTGRDVRVLPKTVVYDPDLTMTLPLALSVTSGLNAIAHAAEGLYTPEPNPIVIPGSTS